MRIAAYALLLVGAGCLIALSFFGRPPAPDLPDNMIVEVTTWDDLPGWGEADALTAWRMFLSTCQDIAASGDAPWGPATEWALVCFDDLEAEAAAAPGGAGAFAHQFFTQFFLPIRIRNNDELTGRFTGYYEPELRGSRTPTDEFPYPLLARPDDLVIVHLSQFPGDHDGRIAGRVQNGNLTPYESRTEIEGGALGDVEVLAWVNPVDAFFLQIQGSGRVVFDDGAVLRAGYAGVNGHPYTAIGRTLIQMGELTLENVSMQAIRDWLHANPDRAGEVMRSNASYVFFRDLGMEDPSLGPIGAAGEPLTPGYSLAIDPRYHAYGAPIYIATTLPDGTPFNRLMVAQDTGGAIRGPIRGDIFFGFGDEAGALAGAMNAQGEMWVLVPNAVAERLREGEDAEAARE